MRHFFLLWGGWHCSLKHCPCPWQATAPTKTQIPLLSERNHVTADGTLNQAQKKSGTTSLPSFLRILSFSPIFLFVEKMLYFLLIIIAVFECFSTLLDEPEVGKISPQINNLNLFFD
ncbi:hypothetical protein [Acetobacter tropicalis]|uniref:Uncharacterized protein n=1 Tax=Acetobacter tropicalis TaxID=104102 RepID=A0A251ZYC1_9PROT|nr:hypothetical protein [Acetobacter tropicalis]OUI79651.1 hypothetical protein HC62_00675 [Acetobacter tropicalis]